MVILKHITKFTGNKLWAFVDSNYVFTNPTKPFPFKDSISFDYMNANQIITELVNALNTMLVASDTSVKLPEDHPGHEAYLRTVAVPRAKIALRNAETFTKTQGEGFKRA